MTQITKLEQRNILQSLSAGLVPDIGLHHLLVGRKREIAALTSDIDLIKDGGATFRVVVGPNGVGKTLLEKIAGREAIESGLVVVSADFTIDDRLADSSGRARGLLMKLMANVRTNACPTGNGLRQLLESFIDGLAFEGNDPSPEEMAKRINDVLRPLKDYPGGFEFAQVLARYYEGHVNDNLALQDAALRWLRAEYSTKTEARQDLGVRRIINDADVHASLKLFAAFCRLAGYGGLLVLLDELSALTIRLPDVRSRRANVQALLTIINDCLQGGAQGLGFVLAGTPDALHDPERGLFQFPALRSRLQSTSASDRFDPHSPLLTLEPLGLEEVVVLLENLRRVHALGDETKYRIPDEGIQQFVNTLMARSGRRNRPNPRDIVRPFLSLLNRLEQEPEANLEDVLDGGGTEPTHAADAAEAELANTTLETR